MTYYDLWIVRMNNIPGNLGIRLSSRELSSSIRGLIFVPRAGPGVFSIKP